MRSPKFLTFVLIVLAGVLGRLNSYADGPSVHFSAKPSWLSYCKPYDKKPSLRDVENGYYYELIERQINIETNADYHHTIRQIVSEAGIQNGSQLSVGFDPAYERLDFHDITIWRDGKPLNRTKTATFKVIADEQDLSKFIYQGSYSAICILSDIRKGDRIEYSYTITGRNPIFGSHFCRDIYLQGGQLYNHQYVSILASAKRNLHLKPFNSVPVMRISETAGLKKYEWESFAVKPVEDADNAPDWYNAYAHVQISDFNNWAEVADWASKINPVSTNIKGELGDQIAKMKAAAGNDKEAYFRAAVKEVQDEVRYMGIEIGEYSHRANHPEKVFGQRYGDCKDKALLLTSMLRADGIDAWMVFVNTNLNTHMDDMLPSSGIFDHAVVMAVVSGKTVWVDATISYQRGSGTELYFPGYGRGLVLRPGENKLTAIPVGVAGKTICEEKYTIDKDSTSVRLDVKTVYTRNEADAMRDKLASSGMSSVEKSYLDYYSKTFNKIDQLDSVRVTDDEKRNILITYESYKVGDLLKKNEETGKYDASFNADMILERLPVVGNRAHTPLALGFPNNVDYTIKVVLPGGWGADEADTSINRDAYRFHAHRTVTGDTLSLNYQYANLKDFVPVNQFDELRADMKDIRDNQSSYAVSVPLSGQDNSDTTTASGVSASTKTNVWLLAYALCLAVVLARLGVWLYSRETPAIVFAPGSSFIQIGGWLVLVLIGLIVSGLIMFYHIADAGFFGLPLWNDYHGGQWEFYHRFLLMFEVTGYVFNLMLTVLCIVLFMRRRDILPQVTTWLFAARLGFVLIDHVMRSYLQNFKTLFQLPLTEWVTIIVAAAWILYLRRSELVQDTFIVPYPETNFSYEQPELA